jgi:hypothetical protein
LHRHSAIELTPASFNTNRSAAPSSEHLANRAEVAPLAMRTPTAYSLAKFTFIESSIFERILPVYLDDDEYSELQQFLMQNSEVGELVPGSGGVRKVRWARPGMGKRGGLRIIYFVRYQPNEFWMLTLYAKAKREDIPAHILKQLLEAFRDG